MKQMQAWRLAETAWSDRVNPVTGASYRVARLVKDPETGAEAMLVHYPAASVTPLHDHPCGHGLLVIVGTLVTQSGTYGPGDLVWYPEGTSGTHGAGPDGPLTVLLFTNKPFAIRYLDNFTE
jgi:quercetin dioxygenase-like cupin family protein